MMLLHFRLEFLGHPSPKNQAYGLLTLGPLSEGDAAVVAGQKTANDVQKRGFSRARRTHQGDHFALFDLHIHAFEDLEFVSA